MSKRDRYQTGVPCWVATLQSDSEKVVGSREPCRLLSLPCRADEFRRAWLNYRWKS
jgi:hypothetical protein